MSKIKIVSQGSTSVMHGSEAEIKRLRDLRAQFPKAVILNGQDFLPNLGVYGERLVIIHHERIEHPNGFRWTPDFTFIHRHKKLINEHKSQEQPGTMEQKVSYAYDQIDHAGITGIVTLSGDGFSDRFWNQTCIDVKKHPLVIGVFKVEHDNKRIKSVIDKYFRF